MKIAAITHAFPVLSETFILRQITGLRALGHQVMVFTESRGRLEPGATVPEGVPVRHLRLNETPTFSSSALLALRLTLQAPRALRFLTRENSATYGGRLMILPRLGIAVGHRRFDVVHCHFGQVGLRFRFAGSLWRAPLVATFYGHDCSRFPLRHPSGVYLPLFDTADLVLALSQQMASRLADLGCDPDKIRVHPLGLDPSEWTFQAPSPVPPGGGRLLTVARLVEKKGIEDAIRAVQALQGERPGLRYEIIGDGTLRGRLEALAQELGVADRVQFRGAQDNATIRRAMQDADLFVLPSVTAGDGDQEGTPTVLLEAQAAGLPVVSTWHSGIPEVVRHEQTGVLVNEHDPRGLAAAVARLLGDAGMRRRMADGGRRLVEEQFDIRRLNRRLEGYYEGLIAAPRSARSRAGKSVLVPASH